MSPSKNIQTYYSNAKLMITGEYLVLRGALALSIPLKRGQWLKVSEHAGSPSLIWKTFVNGQHWFDATFSINEFVIGNTNDFPTAQNLREILIAAKSLNPAFLSKKIKYEAFSELDFHINWGLGSSSSLLANIAKWADIDSFKLFEKVSAGSGYDLATAMSEMPLLYRLNGNEHEIKKVGFYPVFRDHLYFAYMGNKRNSAQAVEVFGSHTEKDIAQRILDTDTITKAILDAKDLNIFRKLMRDHEKIISGVLGVPPLGFKLMSDFNGDIKSLGAWGGDFVLLASDMPRDYVISWLRKKEMKTWFTYEELALKPPN
jgi:mevalonate kinase